MCLIDAQYDIQMYVCVRVLFRTVDVSSELSLNRNLPWQNAEVCLIQWRSAH